VHILFLGWLIILMTLYFGVGDFFLQKIAIPFFGVIFFLWEMLILWEYHVIAFLLFFGGQWCRVQIIFLLLDFLTLEWKKKIFLANRNFLFEWRIQIIEPNFFFSTLPGFLCLHFFKKDLRNLHSFSGLVQIWFRFALGLFFW